MHRRGFALLWSIPFAVALLAQNPPLVVTAGPWLENPSENSVTVSWITNRNATGSVEYSAGGGPAQTAVAARHGLIDANERVHRVTLRGLQPGAGYRYRVLSKDIVDFQPYKVTFGEAAASEYAAFRLPRRGAGTLSFLVFNDIHEDHSVIPQMLEANGKRPYDFVVLNGDILSHIERESQITDMLGDAGKYFAAQTPFVWVRGNHETRGAFARMLPGYLAMHDDRFYYSFDYGPVHFVVLDAGEDKPDANVAYSGLVSFDAYRREQTEWLKREIAADAFRKAPFRVVLVHMPFPEAGRGEQAHGMADAYEQWGGVLNGAGVDLMISAHKHRAAVVEPVKGRFDYPIVRGGGPTPANRTLIRVEASATGLRAVILGPGGAEIATTEAAKRPR